MQIQATTPPFGLPPRIPVHPSSAPGHSSITTTACLLSPRTAQLTLFYKPPNHARRPPKRLAVTRSQNARSRLRRRRTRRLASPASNPDPDPLSLAHPGTGHPRTSLHSNPIHSRSVPAAPRPGLPSPASILPPSLHCHGTYNMIRMLLVLVSSPGYIRRRPRPRCALAA